MPERNENSNITYRFLSRRDFNRLHQTFLAAFADYFVPFHLSATQFENHLAQNSVDLNLSVGAFCEREMVGFTLNGFGAWNGRRTAYDAGTGVTPSFRKRGIGKQMFDFMMPRLRQSNVEQILLEVITKNDQAVRLYRRLRFRETRTLGFFEQKTPFVFDPKMKTGIEIRELKNPDWQFLKTFWDAETSWQNSAEAVEKSSTSKIFLGAYLENVCVGYIVADRSSAVISQFAIDKNQRRKGVASRLLADAQLIIEDGKKMRVSNVDYSLKNAFAFFKHANFEETLSQFEMIKNLSASENDKDFAA